MVTRKTNDLFALTTTQQSQLLSLGEDVVVGGEAGEYGGGQGGSVGFSAVIIM